VRYLTAAEQTGDWLLATADRSPQGWFWPVQPGVCAEVDPSLGWGTAGPAMFFTEAFRTTGDERWLSAARAGARWMDAHLDESARQWAGCGLLTGIGGWAVVLDELAAAAGDEQARDLARRVLETVAAHASADGDAVHWHDLTEMVWGTAGIGCLMLTLGADYLGPAAVDLAVRAGDWLLAQAEAAPAGIRWSLGRAYEAERPDDQRRFPNFAHGAAGIGFFLHQRDPGPVRARVLGQRRPVLRLGGGGRVLPRPARLGGAARGPGLRDHPGGRHPRPGEGR
jgi:lantibiotic modifying enzyme